MNNAADAQCTQHDLKSFKSCESSLTLININIEPLNQKRIPPPTIYRRNARVRVRVCLIVLYIHWS